MADWPGSKKTFTQIVDGVTKMEGINLNTVYNEVEAVQTYLGSIGTGLTQSSAIDTLEFFKKARQSFRVKWIDADTVQVSLGEIVCANAGNTQRVPRKNTSTANVTFTDLDTGARAQSTTYYLFANADAATNTVTFKLSLSATTPTGVTRFGLIGKLATNATGAGEIIESSVVSFVGEVCVQTQYKIDGEVATGTTVIPVDDSKPQQSSDGDKYMELPFLPTDALNIIELSVVFIGAVNIPGKVVVALFQDAIEDAIAVSQQANGGTASDMMCQSFLFRKAAGTTDLITYKVHAGPHSAATLTFNGVNAGRLFAGLVASGIIIKEYRKVYR